MTEEQTTATRPRGQLTGPEKVFVIIVIVVAIGWVIQIDKQDDLFEGLEAWFLTLSLGAAVVIGVLIGLEYFGRLVPPARIYRLALSIACLLPLVGVLVAQLDGIGKTLTVWGSFAITYVGVTGLWRHRIPRFLHDPFRLGSANEDEPTAAAQENSTQEPTSTAPAEGQGSAPAPSPVGNPEEPHAGVDGPPDDGGRVM